MINPIKIIKMRISLPNNCKTDINLPPKVSSLGIKLNITLDNKTKIAAASSPDTVRQQKTDKRVITMLNLLGSYKYHSHELITGPQATLYQASTCT